MTGGLRVSLGSFNAGLAGEASLVCARPAGTLVLNAIAGVRVTGEPFGSSLLGHTTVLEGNPLWLAGPSPHSVAPPVESERPEFGNPEFGNPQFESPEFEPAQPPVECASPAVAAPELAGRLAELESQTATPVQVLAPETVAEAVAEAGAGPESAESGIVEMEELHLEPVPVPIQPAVPASLSVPLSSRHPMAPRATGHAVLQKRTGEIVLTIRGLPSPPSLGRDRSTDRPFNAYRVWLVQQRTGSKHSLGHLTRVWGDNFRFESEPGYPLSRYDAIVITADDRSQPAPNPNGPQVMGGTYIFS